MNGIKQNRLVWMAYTLIGDVAKKFNKTILRGHSRAINKALAQTKTKVFKELRDETGLKTKSLNNRLLLIKSNIKTLAGSLNLATKIGVQITEFSPRPVKVKVNGKTYYGVSAKILGSREFIPGGFLRAVKSGKEIVMARKATISGGTYRNVLGNKYPTALLRTNVLRDIFNKNITENKEFLAKTYKRIVNREVEYSLEQYINKG